MKIKNTLFNEPDGQPTGNSGTELSNDSIMNSKFAKDNIGDVKRFIFATVAASVLYFVFLHFMPITGIILKNIMTVIVVLIFLAIYRSVQETKAVVGNAIILTVLLLFTWQMLEYAANPYGSYTPEQQLEIKKEQEKANQARIESFKADSLLALRNDIEARAMILPTGTHRFNLSANDSTGWLTIPASGKFEYSISSKSFKYKIIYSDGTPLQGSKNGVIPWRARPVFQIKSLEDQTIKVVIKKI